MLLPIVLALSGASAPVAEGASVPLLRLPFSDPAVKPQQGWCYTGSPACSRANSTHRGIDYIKGSTTNPASWQAFEVVAAADGLATYVQGATNATWGYGNHVIIAHSFGADTYYTIYAHLASSPLPAGQPRAVQQGEPIGTAGRTNTSLIHLHFELSKAGVGVLDPYGIYGTRSQYPSSGEPLCRAGVSDCFFAADPPPAPQPPTSAQTRSVLASDGQSTSPDDDADSIMAWAVTFLEPGQVWAASDAAEKHWYKFAARAGYTYSASTFNLGTGTDTFMYVYDSDATTVLAINDDGAGTRASQLTWQAPLSGTYYLMVRHWNSAGGGDASYDITLSESTGGTFNEYELPSPRLSPLSRYGPL